MLKSSIMGLVFKLIGAMLALLSNIMIANYLGMHQSGYYFYLISLLGVSTSMVIFGGQTYLLKAAPALFSFADDVKAARLIVSIVARTVLFSCILVVIFLSILLIFDDDLPKIIVQNPSLRYIIFALPFLAINVVLSHTLQVQGRVIIAFFTSGLSHSIGFAIIIVLVKPDNSEMLSLIYLLISVIVSIHLVSLTYPCLKVGKIRGSDISNSINPSAKFFIVQMGLELLVQSPVLLLGFFGASPSEISGYAISSRVALSLSFVYSIVNRIVMPNFSKYHSKGQWMAMRRDFQNAVLIMSIVSLPVALLFLLFAGSILELFGKEFSQFSDTFFVLVFLQILNVITGPAGNLLIMADQQDLFRNIVLIGLAIVLGLSFIFIPKYGAFGAAIAIMFGYGFVNLASFIISLRIFSRKIGG